MSKKTANKAKANTTAVGEIVTKVLAVVGKKAFMVPDAKSARQLDAFNESFDTADMDAVMVAEGSVLEALRGRFDEITVGFIESRCAVIV